MDVGSSNIFLNMLKNLVLLCLLQVSSIEEYDCRYLIDELKRMHNEYIDRFDRWIFENNTDSYWSVSDLIAI